ncbi:MAG: hypothetical protein K2R98_20150 [Gemmataceae bacterium]|nr:hypothetical protein [Gemmataceae bacterium]
MAARPRSRAWIWFFVVLAFLGAAAITIPTVYNMRQQLTREELDRVRALWKEKGPPNYVLEYVKERDNKKETYIVTVRNGKTMDVAGPMFVAEDRKKEDLYRYYGMIALFNDIEGNLDRDAKPNAPRAFNRATFNPDDGHLIDYVRSVSKDKERVQITVKRFEVTSP